MFLEHMVSRTTPSSPANYRSVSYLSFLGKVTERMIAELLQGFLEGIMALEPFQSGFHPRHGCQSP